MRRALAALLLLGAVPLRAEEDSQQPKLTKTSAAVAQLPPVAGASQQYGAFRRGMRGDLRSSPDRHFWSQEEREAHAATIGRPARPGVIQACSTALAGQQFWSFRINGVELVDLTGSLPLADRHGQPRD